MTWTKIGMLGSFLLSAISALAQGTVTFSIGNSKPIVNEPYSVVAELNPATGDWSVPQKEHTALNRYGTVDEVAALVHRGPGSIVHHRRKPHR